MATTSLALVSTTNHEDPIRLLFYNNTVFADEDQVRSGGSESSHQLEHRRRRKIFLKCVRASLWTGRWLAGRSGGEHRFLRTLALLGAGIGAGRAVVDGTLFAKAVISGIKCRLYCPVEMFQTYQQLPNRRIPVVIYFHGGGWVISSARAYHRFSSQLACDSKAAVVSVEYRLGPEHPFPAGLNDCIACTKYILQLQENSGNAVVQTSNYGDAYALMQAFDTSRVVLAGDSAGGNLAAATALELIRAKDAKEPGTEKLCNLFGLVLICPALQGISLGYPSYRAFGSSLPLGLDWFLPRYAGVDKVSRKLRRSLWQGLHVPVEDDRTKIYLRRISGSGCVSSSLLLPQNSNLSDRNKVTIPAQITELVLSKRAWPMLAEESELAQLPQTLIQICACDPLRDENLIFVQRCIESGASIKTSFIEAAEHVEAILIERLETRASRTAYHEIINYLVVKFGYSSLVADRDVT